MNIEIKNKLISSKFFSTINNPLQSINCYNLRQTTLVFLDEERGKIVISMIISLEFFDRNHYSIFISLSSLFKNR